MNRDSEAWGPTPAAELNWTESGEPYSTQFDDIYYSRENGAAESCHVFLAGNGLPDRWTGFEGPLFCIAETGFGTGLNFLLTWWAWRQLGGRRPRLHYVAVEKYPLSAVELALALAPWPDLAPLATQLAEAWPGRLPGQHRLVFEDGDLVLDLWWDDVAQALPDLAQRGPHVDAWYLDGFAPARNEAMWSRELFAAMAALSRPGATFATFTAAGRVRRGLEAVGFAVEKVPGFGRKRESLSGRVAYPAEPPACDNTPWDLPATHAPPPQRAIVLGAGLAGCSMARALAERGVEVLVMERDEVASRASGNEQGLLYTRLSPRHSTLTDFSLQSFRHAAVRYAAMLAHGEMLPGSDGALCGMFHQAPDEDCAGMVERLCGLEDLARVLSAGEAAGRLGVVPARGGYWFPHSGWFHPPALCRALLRHPLVELRTGCGELSLERPDGSWVVRDTRGHTLAQAPVVVICAGGDSARLAGLDWLPLRSVRGQTSHLPAWDSSRQLRAALCDQGYIAPARNNVHCIGASFGPGDDYPGLREQDHRDNLRELAEALPQWKPALDALPAGILTGRVGFRCTSPDYLPLVGAVPDRDAFLRDYAPLRKNGKLRLETKGSYMEGLYLNTAHGSRGLTSTPLCAQWLASEICGELPPLSRELARAIAPARFLIRDLTRGRI